MKCENCKGLLTFDNYSQFEYVGTIGSLLILKISCNHCGRNTPVKALVLQ